MVFSQSHPQIFSTILLAFVAVSPLYGQQTETASLRSFDQSLSKLQQFVSDHCLECHTSDDAAGDLDLEPLPFAENVWHGKRFDVEPWERMLRRIDSRQMPPVDNDRPTENQYNDASQLLRELLQHRADKFPYAGNVSSLRRMTRLEYQYSIRDLVGIEIDAKEFLPKDESSHGFDNVTVDELSPTHLSRYLSAAQSISRIAVGCDTDAKVGVTIRQPADRSQEQHVEGLPFGTRGGVVFDQHFLQSGEYEIGLKLMRDRDEKIEGLHKRHFIDVLVDRDRVHRFTVQPAEGDGNWESKDHTHLDSHLQKRLKISAGTHSIGVTFPKYSSSLQETKRQPFETNFNRHRHPRRTPAIYQVSIVGPFAAEGAGETVARKRIFGDGCDSATADDSDAERIIARLARRAFRRSICAEDLNLLMPFYKEGQQAGGFESGIEYALTAILVNPNFLFRLEPKIDEESKRPNELDDHQLATRLSYFLWSSLPDERLLDLADAGQLQNDEVLEQEIARMLADDRSAALVDNFASQWLQLRNLDAVTPDLRQYPNFDDNLRQAFRQETQLLFADIIDRNRSVLDLISTDETFLNQRLATHYGIKGVKGSVFRPVAAKSDGRGGILRHGSVLMVTSYATRTSPTLRGNWVLENILGTPAPPPPPNIPNLKDNSFQEVLTVRQRLALHREQPACASCHDRMDPIGFAMENYDAVGRQRRFEDELEIDSSGKLPDGSLANSVAELERAILVRPQLFAQTFTEKLMTFALGRSVEMRELPMIRKIVEDAADQGYCFSAFISGIVTSDSFRKRSSE